MDIINLDVEFSHLTKLINDLWDGCDTENAQKAIQEAFEQGLEDGKLWIDDYATLRIGEALEGDNAVSDPLKKRRKFKIKGVQHASLYDALCRFDSNLISGLSDINGSVTRFGRFDFSENADQLCKRLVKEFGKLDVSPKILDRQAEKAIVNGYLGNDGEEAGSLGTPKKLERIHAEINRDAQGMHFIRTLISTIYSHALYCAKCKNTETLVSDLMPIYEQRYSRINFDNGDEIMAIAMNNNFVRMINDLSPFTFTSTKEYLEQQEKSKKLEAERAKESDVEIEKKRRDSLKNMMEGINTRIDESMKRTDAFVDKKIVNINRFELSAI
jgi:hypothetical protein